MGDDKKKVGAGFGVLILRNGKVLLGRRHEDPEKADTVFMLTGTWTMPGGKLHFGESFEQGAIREVLEETGMQLKNPKVICVNNDKNEYAHFITIGLLAKDEDVIGEPRVMEPDEITEWRWFDLDNLPEKMYFPSLRVLTNYKEKKFYIKEF